MLCYGIRQSLQSRNEEIKGASAPMAAVPRPLVLVVMDGYGINPRKDANAVALARKPNLDLRARVAAYADRDLLPGGGPARGTDGQL